MTLVVSALLEAVPLVSVLPSPRTNCTVYSSLILPAVKCCFCFFAKVVSENVLMMTVDGSFVSAACAIDDCMIRLLVRRFAL